MIMKVFDLFIVFISFFNIIMKILSDYTEIWEDKTLNASKLLVSIQKNAKVFFQSADILIKLQ